MDGYYWNLKVQGRKYDPGQPRVPAGRPEGGQWTDTVDIEQGPFDFIVRLTLEDAKLPASHTDGLRRIEFVEGDYVGGDAFGTYTPGSDTIRLASNPPKEKGPLGNIYTYGGATVLHEIGHHVHMAKLTNEAAREWESYSRGGRSGRISAYARKSSGEHFAECYRAYARGKGERRKLRNIEPWAYKFLQPLFSSRGAKKFLPEGIAADEHEQWARYHGEFD